MSTVEFIKRQIRAKEMILRTETQREFKAELDAEIAQWEADSTVGSTNASTGTEN